MTTTTIQEAAFHGSFKDAISEGAKTATESLKGVGRAAEEMSKKVTGATPSLEQLNRRLDENSRLAAATGKANKKHADTLAAIERERRAGLITEARALDLSERAVRLRDMEIEKARRQADAMRLMQGSYRETAGAAAACASANDNLARASALSHRQMQSLQAAAVNTFQSIAAGLPVGQTLITQAGQMAGAFGALSVTTLAVGAGLLVATGSAAGFARAMATAGDAVTATEGRLKIATGSLGAAHDAYERLHGIALQTGVAVSESAGGFVRFSLAARSIGATNDHVLALVGTVQKLAIASGATAQETTAATQQLGQALASGRLQGDELRSILENLPALGQAIATGLGVSIGKLREMGEAGQLTADKVFKAVLSQGAAAERMFGQMPMTIERASNVMAAAWTHWLAGLDKSTGLSAAVAQGIHGLAVNLETVASSALNVAGVLGTLLAARAIPAVITGMAGMNAGAIVGLRMMASFGVGAVAQMVAVSAATTAASAATGALGAAWRLIGGAPGAIFMAAAAALYAYATRTTAAETATSQFERASRVMGEATKAQAGAVDDLARSYERLSPKQRDAEAAGLKKTLDQQIEGIRQQKAAMREAMRTSGMFDPVGTAIDFEGTVVDPGRLKVETLGLAAEQATALQQALAGFHQGGDGDAAALHTLYQTVTDIGQALGEAGTPLVDLGRAMATGSAQADTLAGNVRELEARITLLKNPTDAAALAIVRAAEGARAAQTGFSGAASMAGKLGDTVRKLAEETALLRVPEGYARDLAQAYQQAGLRQPLPAGSARNLGVAPVPGGITNAPARTPDHDRVKNAFDTNQRGEAENTLKALEREIKAQQNLAAARATGNQGAIKQAEADTELAKLSRQYGANLDEVRAKERLRQKGLADLTGEVGAAVTAMERETAATQRLTGAYQQGEAAIRERIVQNQILAEIQKGTSEAPDSIARRIRAQADAVRDLAAAQNDLGMRNQIEDAERLATAWGHGAQAAHAAALANQALAQIRQEGANDNPERVQQITGNVVRFDRAQQRLALGEQLSAQRDEIGLIRKEYDLLGASDAVRARSTAEYQAELDLRRHGLDLATAESQAFIRGAGGIAEMRAELEKARSVAEDFASTLAGGIGDFPKEMADDPALMTLIEEALQ